MKNTVRLLMSALLAAVLCLCAFCTIRDENGSPINPGTPSDNNGGNGGGGGGSSSGGTTLTVGRDAGDFNTDSTYYVRPNDTISLRIHLKANTDSSTAGISGKTVTVRRTDLDSNKTTQYKMGNPLKSGKQTTVETDKDGFAVVKFLSTTSGTAELTFQYVIGSNDTLNTKVRVEITETPRQNMDMSYLLLPDPVDGTKKAVVTVQVRNAFNNPVVGDSVIFSADAGIITAIGVTNSDGKAAAELTNDNDNEFVTVIAALKNNPTCKDTIDVIFVEESGQPLRRIYINADPKELSPNGTVTVSVLVKNSTNNPVQNEEVRFTSTAGLIDAAGTTNNRGKASVILTQDGDNCSETAVVTAFLASDPTYQAVGTVPFTCEIPPSPTFKPSINILNPPDGVSAEIGETIEIEVKLFDDNDLNKAPLNGQTITVYVQKPERSTDYELDNTTLTTDANGKATVKFTSKVDGRAELRFIYGTLPTPNAEASMSIQVYKENPPRNIFMTAAPWVLSADGASKSVITVQIRHPNDNNPIVGSPVKFTTNFGWITASGVTDNNGKVTAELTSDRGNHEANVKAVLENDPSVWAEVTVIFRGASVSAWAETRGRSSTVRATVRDGAGNPNTYEDIYFFRPIPAAACKNENNITILDSNCPYVIQPDNPPPGGRKTNNRGMDSVIVTSTNIFDTIIVASAGAVDTVFIRYSDNILNITRNPTGGYNIANNSDSSTFVIGYTTSDNAAIGNATLQVSVTSGNNVTSGNAVNDPKLDTVFVLTTNSSGTANFTMNNPDFTCSTTVFVKAYSANSNDTTEYSKRFDYVSNTVARIEITGSPNVIGVNGDRATITATAYDSKGNRVKGALIAFNFDKNPLDGGGGEYLYPASAVTRNDGTAVTELTSGAIPSFFQSVAVTASNFLNPTATIVSNTIYFTIVGPPKYITIRRNLEEIVKYTSTYGKKFSAIVTDVNRNPVIDGTPITFSADITGYVYYSLKARFEVDKQTMEYKAFIDTVPNSPIPSECIRSECINSRGYARIDYKPYPRFNDINRNGVPDKGWYVEPCSPGGKVDVYSTQIPILDTIGWSPTLRPIVDTNKIFIRRTGNMTADDRSGNALYWVLEASNYGLYDGNNKMVFNLADKRHISYPDPELITLWMWNNDTLLTDDAVNPVIGYTTTFRMHNDSTPITNVLGYKNMPCDDGVWADYNGNNARDSIECFIDTITGRCDSFLTNVKYAHLYNDNIPYPNYHPDYDLDVNWNGVPDPMTTVALTRTVLTKDGIADNELIYGQSDGGRIEVTIWAEAQGLETKAPERFVLPIEEGSGKYWNYFD